MKSRADRIKTLLKQRAAIDDELDQIRAQVAVGRKRTPRKPRKPRQPQLALVGEAQ